MDNNPLISVIVPVYKVEQYLERCVKSIINQTYKNLEIILVDDGSPDRCGEMCDEFAKKDRRIRVFHKENGGQSSARNLGLDNMTGDYVGFVDSDDWIDPKMYEHLHQLIIKNNAQIAACGTCLEHLNGKVSYFNLNYPNEKGIRVYTMLEALEESFNNQRITYSPCDKLYDKKIFKFLRMTEGRIYEDMEIIPKCIEQADVIVYDSEPLYHYNLTQESTIRGVFNLKRFAEADVALERAEDYAKRYPKLYGLAKVSYINICLGLIYFSKGCKDCNERRNQLIKEIREIQVSKYSNVLTRNIKVKLCIFKISPKLYQILMNIYKMFSEIFYLLRRK